MASLLFPLPHTDSHTAAARAGADPAAQGPLPTTGATIQPCSPNLHRGDPKRRGGRSDSVATHNDIKTKLGALSVKKA